MMMECVYCEKIFQTFLSLKRHQKSKYFCKKKTFQCSNCKNYYRSAQSLKAHKSIYCQKTKSQSLINDFTTEWFKPLGGNDVSEVTETGIKTFSNEMYPKLIFRTMSKLHCFSKNGKFKNDDDQKRELLRLLIFIFTQHQMTIEELINIIVYL